MGQIIGSAAKPKRCNLNKLSQLGTPAAGEHILVSSDNSMNASGQGNFDCYIVGEGKTAATALPLKRINAALEEEVSQLDKEVNGFTTKNYTEGYKVLSSGALQEDSTSVVCIKIPVSFGQTITFTNSYSYICAYDENDVKLNDWSARTNVLLTSDSVQNVSYILASFKIEKLATASITRGATILWKPTENITLGLSERVEDLEENQTELQRQATTKNYTPDSYTTTSGIASGHTGYFVTEKIAGAEGDVVYLGNLGNPSNRYALAYNEQGEVIGSRSNAYGTYTLPTGTASFVVCFGANATDLRVYKNNAVVWEKTDSPSRLVDIKSIIDSTDKELGAVSKETQDSYGSLFFEELIPPTFYFPYSITENGTLGTTTTYMHIILCVEEGDVIRLVSKKHTRNLLYALLTTPSISNTSGEVLPLVSGTTPQYYSRTGNLGQSLMGDVVVVVPTNCKAIIVDVLDITSTYFVASIRRNRMDGVVSCYKEYISARAFDIRKRDIMLGQNADSCIFLTDYHIPNGEDGITTNFGHSPALVKFLQEHTNTTRFLFGGDVFTSPETDEEKFALMDAFLTLFNFTTMYSAVGNHEWRQSTDLGHDGRTYDFGSLAKKLEGLVTFGRNAQGEIMQPYYFFDNPALKMRYFVLYTPGPLRNSSYAVFDYQEQLDFVAAHLGELDSSWSAIIMQHIVYAGGNGGDGVVAEYDEEGFPIKYPTSDVGMAIKSLISQNNQTDGAKIVALLSGHTHNDFCEFVDGYCISICVDCDATYGRYNGNDDVVYPNNHTRRWGTTNEQCFDVFHILKDGSKVYGTRIGFGYDKIVNTTEQAVGVGSTTTLTPTIIPSSWVSQNDSIATISNGVVTGVSAGRVTIKAVETGTPNGRWEYFNIVVSE